VEHAAPCAQVMQAPLPSQTMPEPQPVPGGWGPPLVQIGAPVVQAKTPLTQTPPSFPVQVFPAAQAMQLPTGSHTWPEPQVVPASRLPDASLHFGVPEQARTPFLQAVGLVAQAAPSTHATQLPAVQIFWVPHDVPSDAGRPSTHTGAPSAHEMLPSRHGAPAFSVQPASGMQSATQPPSMQDEPEPQAGWQPPLAPPPSLPPPVPTPPPVPPSPEMPVQSERHVLSAQQLSPPLHE
jgi:hypothetical protein